MSEQVTFSSWLKAIADAIRSKKGTTEAIKPINFASEIESITTGGGSGGDSPEQEFLSGNSSVLTSNVSIIGDNKFRDDKYISGINLPFCTELGQYAFFCCTNLLTINLPNCVKLNASSLAGNSGSTSIEHPLFTEISLPSCEYVGSYAFTQNRLLEKVNLPMCKEIKDYAFNFCMALNEINLPICEILGNNSFMKCEELTKVDLPNCNKMGWTVFQYCSKLETVILRYDGVVTIESRSNRKPFYNLPNVKIYVKKAWLDSYLSGYWSEYSSQLYAIEDYPEICG